MPEVARSGEVVDVRPLVYPHHGAAVASLLLGSKLARPGWRCVAIVRRTGCGSRGRSRRRRRGSKTARRWSARRRAKARATFLQELRPSFALRCPGLLGRLPLLAALLHDALGVCAARSSEERAGYQRGGRQSKSSAHRKSPCQLATIEVNLSRGPLAGPQCRRIHGLDSRPARCPAFGARRLRSLEEAAWRTFGDWGL
jgi:hypothetical protein